MSINLSPEFVAKVQATLATSGHGSAEELLADALRQWESLHEWDDEDEAVLEECRPAPPSEEELIRSLEEANASIDRGEGIPQKVVFDELWERLEKRLRHG